MRRRVAVVGVALGAVLVAADLVRPLPSAWFEAPAHRRVLDRSGGLLAERPVPRRGHSAWVELSDVSPAVVDALLAAEDDRFWSHHGIDPMAVGRAARANWGAGEVVQGGSTLTQQTARLLAGRPSGLWGKAVEGWRAVKLDAHLDKDELLTWYLNRAYFGAGATGIASAASRTFDEGPGSLSISEAATLVAALPAPSRLHPSVDPEASRRARDRVLGRMVATGRLSAADAALARSEPLQLRMRRPEGLAPHLVARLLDGPQRATQTFIDPDLQQDAERLVAEAVAALGGRDVDHAAALVVHVPTSEVRAWVGSADFSADDGQVDGARALRSPGSTLKPFLYGLAFAQGWRPADVICDLPLRYGTDHGVWAPENYDRDFRGPVRLREALAGSYNVPAVVLLEDVGVATLQGRLQAMGFKLSGSEGYYGLGLALGDAGVSLEQLVAAYAGLARGGVWQPLRVHTGDREVDGVRFLEPADAWLVADILADPVARVPGFGRRTPLARPYPAAVKTGTSTDYRDNWTVGFSGEWAVGVWVGNFDGRAMGDVSGVTGAAPLWANLLDRVTQGHTTRPERPSSLVLHRTCALSGGAAGRHCPHTVEDWTTDPTQRPTCSWHGEGCRVAWPPELLPWAAEGDRVDDACEEGQGAASIAWPRDGSILYVDPRFPAERQRVALRAAAPAGARWAEWFANGDQIGAGTPATAAMWQPETAGLWRLSLVVDGQPAGSVRVEVQGVP